MKRRWFCSCTVSAILLATALASAQPAKESSTTLAFENGTIVNGIYSNECFGFSLPIPAGWEVNDTVTPGGKARHSSSGKDLILLFLEQQKKTPGRIILSAWDSASYPGSARDFVSDGVHAPVNQSTGKNEPLQDSFAVDYGGIQFFRSNQKAFVVVNIPWYSAKIYTEFRGYFIGANLLSTSPGGLDEAANSLQKISFQVDQVNPKCVMTSNASTAPAGAKIAAPERVRVSSGVATGLLVKRVRVQYPEDAKKARVKGKVVMKAEIDKEGNVEALALISGDPMLAPAALEAVKQWKYKPYLLNGQPVKVETQVVVNFTLSRF
jgi:TonB family protein